EDHNRRLCVRLMKRGKLDYVALQLRNASAGIIETVAGTDFAQAWVGRARHPLSKQPSLRDIQADIVLEKRGEVVVGADDPRLDPGLYEQHHHDGFIRVFVPLIIFRDAETRLLRPDLSLSAKWLVEASEVSPASKYILRVVAPEGV